MNKEDQYEAFLKSEIERVSKLDNISIIEKMKPYTDLQHYYTYNIDQSILKEKMNKHPLDLVTEFMKVMDHPVLDTPQIPSYDRVSLRIELIREEFEELIAAIRKEDIVEIADAFMDLDYVLQGAKNEFGFNKANQELFEEVHRSNMSKVCTSDNEALVTQLKYKSEGVNVNVVKKDNYFIVERVHDKKTLKSINYSKANLKPIIDKYL